MELSNQILSEITHHMKQARFISKKKRRETWLETTDRSLDMHLRKFPSISSQIIENWRYVEEKQVLPSLRSLQFGGACVEKNNSRLFNCAYTAVDDPFVFAEIMFRLLSGTGVGYSVQKHHIQKLPAIKEPGLAKRYLIGDSIEGWSDAVWALVKAYFYGSFLPRFDFSDIREKGAKLITSGGKAPGPEPLRECLENIHQLLASIPVGEKISPIQAHDLNCFIADAVLSGGIRRAAMLCLFDRKDKEMLYAKSGEWWKTAPQRARANNSAVFVRGEVTEAEFREFMKAVEESGAGEPGISWHNREDFSAGFNPSLRAGTLVWTDEGICPIEKLEGKAFYVRNIDGKKSMAKCFLSGKDKQLYKITLQNGKEYYATPEHKWPVYAGDGSFVKVESQNLAKGSYLPILKTNDLGFGTLGTQEDGFFVGWLYGDGWFSARKGWKEFGMVLNEDAERSGIGDRLLGYLRSINPEFDGAWHQDHYTKCKVISINNKKIADHLEQFGIDKKEFGLPKILFNSASEEFRKGFIDGLYSSDGSFSVGDNRIIISSSRKQMAEDLRSLLGFYGVKATLRGGVKKNTPVFPNGKTYDRQYEIHFVGINSAAAIEHFTDTFPLSNAFLKAKIERRKSTKPNFERDELIRIKSVELSEVVEDVWDITVYDETHCFQIDQCITGNCHEINTKSFCNLTTFDSSKAKTQAELQELVRAASFLGTLQASYTDFHYLRKKWQLAAEEESLLGVSMTGITDGGVLGLDLAAAARAAVRENRRVADLIGINHAHRVTTIKPEGTSSLILGTASGAHSRHAEYYIRRVRVGKNEAIYKYLVQAHPELVEDDYFKPAIQAVISVPQKSPEGALTRSQETAIDTLTRGNQLYRDWILPGHVQGENTHNVSLTVSVKPDEWEEVTTWMWEHRNEYAGISLLPYDGGTYVQAPFEDTDEATYRKMMDSLTKLDLTLVTEDEDNTSFSGEISCGGGNCEVV